MEKQSLNFIIENHLIIGDLSYLGLLLIFLLSSGFDPKPVTHVGTLQKRISYNFKYQLNLLYTYFSIDMISFLIWGWTSHIDLNLSLFIYKYQPIIYFKCCKLILLIIFISVFKWFFQTENHEEKGGSLTDIFLIFKWKKEKTKWETKKGTEKIMMFPKPLGFSGKENEPVISGLTPEAFFLINVSFIALSSLLFAKNFLHIYLLLELYGITAYTLTGYSNNPKALRASGKYFLLGSLGSFIILLSLLFIYFLYGHLDFQIIERSIFLGSMENEKYNTILISLFFIGLFFKFGLAPFHTWLIEVYNNTSFFIYVYFMIIPKFFLLIFFVKYVYFVASAAFALNLSYILFGLGLVNIIVGTFIPLTKWDLKELLTISSFSNFGYSLLLISSCSFSAACSGLFAYLIYIVIFLSFILQIYKSIKGNFFYTEISLYKLNDLPIQNKVLIAFLLLTLSGLPPFGLFFGKLILLIPLLQMKAFVLAIIFLFFSSLSAYYYVRLLHLILVSTPGIKSKLVPEASWVFLFVLPSMTYIFNSFA